MLILGLNMFHGDASAALIQDGKVVFAIAEERLNRVKHFGGVPALSIQACLDSVGADIADIDHLAVGRDKDANLAKKVQYALANPAKLLNFIQIRKRREAMNDLKSLLSKAIDVDLSRMRFQEHNVEHHIAHIASAFYCSGMEEAAGFSYDGSGDLCPRCLHVASEQSWNRRMLKNLRQCRLNRPSARDSSQQWQIDVGNGE